LVRQEGFRSFGSKPNALSIWATGFRIAISTPSDNKSHTGVAGRTTNAKMKTEIKKNEKIVITGAAGLVGQNLIPRLKTEGCTEIVAIDKHSKNVKILEKHHPDIRVVHEDLAAGTSRSTAWEQELAECPVRL
jgi:NADPH:quinone reductase-like Zn-dependent oxidoreductase